MGNFQPNENLKTHVSLRINKETEELFEINKLGTLERKDYYLTKSCNIYFDFPKKNIIFTEKKKNSKVLGIEKKLVLDLEEKNLKYYGNGKKMKDLIWQYINPKKKYEIKKNDYLRIGKIILKIKELNSNEKNPNFDFQIQNQRKKIIRIKKQKNECIICSFNDSKEDPFLNLCNCSIKNPIHLNCLKKWLNSKINKNKKQNFIIYDFEKIVCPICKEILPLFFIYENKKIFLLDLEFDFFKEYCFFEIYDKDFNNFKGFFFLFFENQKKFRLGRSEKNDIVFKENFISRFHCNIFLENNQFFVEDLNSKYGTFFLFFKPIFPKLKNNIFLQIDNFFFIIHFFYLTDYCICFKNDYIFSKDKFQKYIFQDKKEEIEKKEKIKKKEKIQNNFKKNKQKQNLKVLKEKNNNILKKVKTNKFLKKEKFQKPLHDNEINNDSSSIFFNSRIKNQTYEFN